MYIYVYIHMYIYIYICIHNRHFPASAVVRNVVRNQYIVIFPQGSCSPV